MFILLQSVKVHISIQIRNVDAKRKIDMKGGTVLDGIHTKATGKKILDWSIEKE